MKHLRKRLWAGLLAGVILLMGACGAGVKTEKSQNPAREDMKAVWVSTVYNLDYPTRATTDPAALKSQADSILQNCVDMGMNAVILQVRPSCDALYPSEIFPWSRYLTGSQNQAPQGDFDPLAYWVEKAHALGLELHAWINPFRVTKSGDSEYQSLSASSPAKQHPEWLVQHEGNYYLNPGLPEVRELVIQGAEELARNYDIDGLHMDDYFYPGQDFDDAAAFQKYGGDFSDLGDWRRDNVNQLVKELGERLHAIDPELSYGISPAGVWANQGSHPDGSATNGNETYFNAYADSRKWVKEEYIDYICPQIYWYIGHKAADYDTLVRWWADVVDGTDVRLYVGMADYQAGNSDPSSPWYGVKALEDMLALNKTIPQVSGEVHFRYQLMVQNPEIVALYQKEYAQPDEPEEPDTPEEPEETVKPVLNQTDHGAYIQGAEGLFRPGDSLSRAEAVAMLARLTVDENGQALYQEGESYPVSFSDVAGDSWYASYVGFAQKYNIVGGYEDGTFRPDQPVTRAELMKILAAYFPGETGSASFTDVPETHWAYQAVAFGAGKGFVAGYEDGTFRPDQPVTRAEAVKMINGALGRIPAEGHLAELISRNPFQDVDESHWAYGNILEASVAHNPDGTLA